MMFEERVYEDLPDFACLEDTVKEVSTFTGFKFLCLGAEPQLSIFCSGFQND